MSERTPERRAPRIAVRNVCDSTGASIPVLPDFMTSQFMRSTFRKDQSQLLVHSDGSASTVSPTLMRAQIPYLVTLLVYKSKFQMTPLEQEWLLYALPDLKTASTNALTMWKRWFKPSDGREKAAGIALEDRYPMVADGVIVEPIDDAFYDECWAHVRKHPHKAAGHPDDPWLFTSLDDGFKIYRHTDRQQGLIYRL